MSDQWEWGEMDVEWEMQPDQDDQGEIDAEEANHWETQVRNDKHGHLDADES